VAEYVTVCFARTNVIALIVFVVATLVFLIVHLVNIASGSTCTGFIQAFTDAGICNPWQIYIFVAALNLVSFAFSCFVVYRAKQKAVKHFQELGTDLSHNETLTV
jgi:hypothetical protein